jgi:prevent-host-death family protein
MPKQKPQIPSKLPRYIGAGEFKSKCLGLMDQVSERKEEIIITKHGQPLVKLVPFEGEIPDLSGYLKGSLEIKGDIVQMPAVHWNADA